MRTIDKLANSGGIVTVVSGVSDGSAGTPSTVAIDVRDHVGRSRVPTAVIPVPTSAADAVAVTNITASEVTVESSGSETAFDLIII